jgi:hypothetical protein
MSVKLRVAVFSLAFAAFATGCMNAPIMEVTDAPVETVGRPATLADVEKAIIRAGSKNGWRMSSVKPGLAVGTYTQRERTVTIEVPYTAKAYSIKYKDSVNMDYNGSQIRKGYNDWVIRLDRAIRVELSLL